MSSPPLTTIDMPLAEMAAEAVQTLLRRNGEPADPRRKIVFDTTLIQRASVQRPAKR
jgi:DNA-binding LacI/PurR family transcriptional regulator